MTNIKYKLVPYNDSDKQFIYDIKKLSYENYVIENYGEWNEELQQKMFLDYIKDTAQYIKIVYINDTMVGFIDGKDVDENTYSQGNICILPKFQCKGIGTSILKQIILDHPKQDITLRVFKQNRAKELYQRLGFEIFDETKSHYLMIHKSNKNN